MSAADRFARTGVRNGGLTAEAVSGDPFAPHEVVVRFEFSMPFVATSPVFEPPLALMRDRTHEADVSERLELAHRFAAAAYKISSVREIRLSEVDEELVVTALTAELDMERDLALQRLFRETVGGDAIRWTLRVRPLGYEDSPDDDGALLP
jgi:hypothetical protein